MAGHRDLNVTVSFGAEVMAWELHEVDMAGMFDSMTDKEAAEKATDATKEGIREMIMNEIAAPQVAEVMSKIEDKD